MAGKPWPQARREPPYSEPPYVLGHFDSDHAQGRPKHQTVAAHSSLPVCTLRGPWRMHFLPVKGLRQSDKTGARWPYQSAASEANLVHVEEYVGIACMQRSLAAPTEVKRLQALPWPQRGARSC